jgi:DedD protein
MKWAFWRHRGGEAADAAPRKGSGRASAQIADTGEPDPARDLRIAARRRLIGAAVLLLAAIVLVPMVLDPAPPTVPDSVPIDIPSDRPSFTPRLNLPPSQRAAADAGAPQPAVRPAGLADPASPASPIAAPASAALADGATPKPVPEAGGAQPVAHPRSADQGRYALQAAALGSESAARELSERLKKAGYTPFTEKVSTREGARWRVRVGPYAGKEEAERARAGLRELGVNANLVIVER